MAKKRNPGKVSARKVKRPARDMPVRARRTVKGGSSLADKMADAASLGSSSLQQAATSSSQTYSAISQVSKSTSDATTTIIRNVRG